MALDESGGGSSEYPGGDAVWVAGRAAYSSRIYTVDNPINRLILAAYATLCGKFRGEMTRLPQSNRRLRRPPRTCPFTGNRV